jgi:hypothetical protein
MSRSYWALGLAILVCLAVPAYADTITVGGAITQSPSDSGTPAVNNPSLNGMTDGDAYTVTLSFTGSITAPGTYNLATGLSGASLAFSDATASASETAFDYANSSLSITETAGVDYFTLLGCLTTGTSCATGNELDLYFNIPAGNLNSQNVTASATPLLTPPLELLEDDGATNVFGTATTYSYTAPAVPEPGSLLLAGLGLLALALVRVAIRA